MPRFVLHGENLEKLKINMKDSLRSYLEDASPQKLSNLPIIENPSLKTIEVDFQFKGKQKECIRSINLSLPYVHHEVEERRQLIYVPHLGLNLYQPEESISTKQIKEEIFAALVREKYNRNFRDLALLDLEKGKEESFLEKVEVKTILLRTKKVLSLKEKPEKEKSVLKEIARPLHSTHLATAFEVKEEVEKIGKASEAKKIKSLLLVGESGVGKTAIFHEWVNEWKRGKQKQNYEKIWQTSGSRIVSGMTYLGEWEERCDQIVREATQDKAVLFLGNLTDLVQSGTHSGSDEGVASYLKKHIASGEIFVVLETTPREKELVEQSDPGLLHLFQEIKVSLPSKKRMLAIINSWSKSQPGKIDLDQQAQECVWDLHERFGTYSSFPGRVMYFLEFLRRDFKGKVSRSQVVEQFSRQTGLPLFLLDEAVTLDPDWLAQFFQDRLKGQQNAIERVVSLICLIKAELTDPEKPIASFLFAGPTGVGKTEMAKNLAEFFFGNRERLIRFDMSEYMDEVSVARLIGTNHRQEGELVAKARQQPFCVFLLDEIEKAHPLVFDVLLQVLGEGRLTDARGVEANFRNCIIIMTSNLGAQEAQVGRAGFHSEEITSEEIFLDAAQKFFRPEFINRIDSLISFSALSKNIIQEIAFLEITKSQKREGFFRRHAEVIFHPEAVKWLAEVGYHPLYGARPLKRALEKHFLVSIGEAINQKTTTAPLELKVSMSKGKPQVKCRALLNAEKKENQIEMAISWTEKISRLRRLMVRLQRSDPVVEMANELHIMDLEVEAKRKKNPNSARLNPLEEIRRLDLQKFQANLEQLLEEIELAEDMAIMSLRESESNVWQEIKPNMEECEKKWRKMLLETSHRWQNHQNKVILLVNSSNDELLEEFVPQYHLVFEELGFEVRSFFYFTCPEVKIEVETDDEKCEGNLEEEENEEQEKEKKSKKAKNKPAALRLRKMGEYLDHSFAKSVNSYGFLMEVKGEFASLLASGEMGTHLLREPVKNREREKEQKGAKEREKETPVYVQVLNPFPLPLKQTFSSFFLKPSGNFTPLPVKGARREYLWGKDSFRDRYLNLRSSSTRSKFIETWADVILSSASQFIEEQIPL